MDGQPSQAPPPRRSRLRVQIPETGAGGGGGRPLSGSGSARPASFVSFPMPVPGPRTPITPGVTVTGPDGGPWGTLQFYPKASDYVFQQFKGFKDFTLNTAKSGLSLGEKTAFWCYGRVRDWSTRWFTHIFLLSVVMAYSLLGAAIFVAVEGPHEDKQRADIFRERKAFLHKIRDLSRGVVTAPSGFGPGGRGPSVGGSDQGGVPEVTYPLDDEAWEIEATASLRAFEEQLYASYTLGVKDTNKKVWGFWNSVFFCGTIFTTIGYGHIAPATTTGRAITIAYAILGIPMFLILLADFGKLFTRGIKFLWLFVRRLYYTGSCRKVRRTARVQEVMKGVQLVYDFATFRRPSQVVDENGSAKEGEKDVKMTTSPSLGATLASPEGSASQGSQAVGSTSMSSITPEPAKMGRSLSAGPVFAPTGNDPGTPALSNFEVDDEFNLPISVAILILLLYIFFGATIYYSWEEWGFFESFYFVFISMSTIGFGDYVPQHPMYMMASIIYLVFGLALTSMCINVVQEKLSDSFKQASVKLGATIGLQVTEEEEAAMAAQKVELAEVHSAGKKQNST